MRRVAIGDLKMHEGDVWRWIWSEGKTHMGAALANAVTVDV
jgi:hypothetical protein